MTKKQVKSWLDRYKDELLGFIVAISALVMLGYGVIEDTTALILVAMGLVVAMGPKYFAGLRVSRDGVDFDREPDGE